ncbi:hypothetical protein [Noviherbaspirillum sp.]|uniref:hypothetical protein n=1 Tax=Noviherbaspirillum sp. TaxID=1926288 RepID=UPI002D2552D2|nr:hypothetical protein [Noviherbaspirillum sp.]HZW20331.1 hypothetical protein [Noviherbaspirillum sp.]
MNNHPSREVSQGKPSRPPHEDGIPEDGISMDAGERADDAGGEPSGTLPVRPISRETAERIPSDSDPDDPASP